jgi:hypothetical protein
MANRKTSRVWRALRWLLLLLLVAAGVAVWQRFAPSPREPVYANHRLSYWLRGHPRDYTPVVQAVGTNALPYLLAELQLTDPVWLCWAERQLGDFGTPWEPERSRHYHARLALQILDTNALPALLETAFARPIQLAHGDAGYEAAYALRWLSSPAAQEAIQQQLATTMRSPDAATRRNACLVIAAGNGCNTSNAAQLAVLTRDPEPAVRAAATHAAQFYNQDESVLLPAVIERLADEQALVRLLAADSLRGRGTNAVAALPALRSAYAAEPSRPRGADQLDAGYPRDLTPARVRAALREALHAIDPKAALPVVPQSD